MPHLPPLSPRQLDALAASRRNWDAELDEIDRDRQGYTRFADRRRQAELTVAALDAVLDAYGRPRTYPASPLARVLTGCDPSNAVGAAA